MSQAQIYLTEVNSVVSVVRCWSLAIPGKGKLPPQARGAERHLSLFQVTVQNINKTDSENGAAAIGQFTQLFVVSCCSKKQIIVFFSPMCEGTYQCAEEAVNENTRPPAQPSRLMKVPNSNM